MDTGTPYPLRCPANVLSGGWAQPIPHSTRRKETKINFTKRR